MKSKVTIRQLATGVPGLRRVLDQALLEAVGDDDANPVFHLR